MKRFIFPNSIKTSRMNVIVNLQRTLQNAAFGICYVLAMMDKRISLLVMRNSILKNVDYVVAHYHCLAKLVKFRKLTRELTQREMIPSNPRGRRLIVVYGHSALEVFALDRCFGGDQDRATINLSTLKGTIQELLGKSNCDGKNWSVVDGFQKR